MENDTYTFSTFNIQHSAASRMFQPRLIRTSLPNVDGNPDILDDPSLSRRLGCSYDGVSNITHIYPIRVRIPKCGHVSRQDGVSSVC